MVSPEILRRGVNCHIDSQLQWLLIDRRSEGVIDDRSNALRFCEIGYTLYVGELQKRIRGRLDVNQLGVGTRCIGKLIELGLVDKGSFNSPIRQQISKELRGRGVVSLLSDNMVSTFEQHHHGREDGAHA